jgi:tight adherence protein C
MHLPPQTEESLYAVAAGLSAFGLALYLGLFYGDYVAGSLRRLRSGGRASSALFRVLKPVGRFFGQIISAVAANINERLPRSGLSAHVTALRVGLQRTLVSAGSPEGLTADEMLGLVLFSLLAWLALGVLAAVAIGSSFTVLVGGVVGLAQPLLWLRSRLEGRRNRIRKLLPYALDLLTLSVEAGLDFTAALARLAPKLGDTPLADELGEMLRVIRLGRSRSEALRDLADRVGMSEVTSFAGSLIQADELGADLGPVLRVLAEQMRNDRSNRAEKKAMEAPVKILAPLIIFIFPTVFLIIFAGIGMEYLKKLFAG